MEASLDGAPGKKKPRRSSFFDKRKVFLLSFFSLSIAVVADDRQFPGTLVLVADLMLVNIHATLTFGEKYVVVG